MRINRFLASCGLGSRRQCETLVLAGKVAVNNVVVDSLSTTIAEDDVVTYEGKVVRPNPGQTVLLHKPQNFICTRHDPKDRPTIYDLLPPPLKTLHYVGRLDWESEGMIILTNDGDLTLRLTHPRHHIEKEYLVALNRPFDTADISKLKAGILIEEDGLAQADHVHVLSQRVLSVTLHQGLNRQVRKMFEALEYSVTRLVRVRIGALELGTLKPGKWKVLHEPDLLKLQSESPDRKAIENRLKAATQDFERSETSKPAKEWKRPLRDGDGASAPRNKRPFGEKRGFREKRSSYGENGGLRIAKQGYGSSRPSAKRPGSGPKPPRPAGGRPAGRFRIKKRNDS